jgi:hypothetical protein
VSGPGGGARRFGGGRGLRRFGQVFGGVVELAEHDAARGQAGLDPPLNLAFGDAVEHLGVGRRRFGSEVAVVGSEVAEILRDRLHGRERVVEPFQGAGEGAIGHRQDLARTHHLRLLSANYITTRFTIRWFQIRNRLRQFEGISSCLPLRLFRPSRAIPAMNP